MVAAPAPVSDTVGNIGRDAKPGGETTHEAVVRALTEVTQRILRPEVAAASPSRNALGEAATTRRANGLSTRYCKAAMTLNLRLRIMILGSLQLSFLRVATDAALNEISVRKQTGQRYKV